MNIIKMKKQCKKCKYSWESRINNPKVCPYCKSYNWNKEKEVKEDETN
jgi:predicted Zn-ribbon and HTH transcriptional regulator